MSVKKEEAKGQATNVTDGDFNPNKIVTFIDHKAPKVTVYTTEKVAKKHLYPKVGTEVVLPEHKAAKWIEKGWGTKEAPTDSSTSKTSKK